MKVTALLSEDLINEVKKFSGGKNITESLQIALNDYIQRQRLRKAMKRLKNSPLEFTKDFTAENVRRINREG
ncbi:MAG TPA: hypothetical protein VL728_16720 [Cyclobacteriaceae bacterium]|jgi:hypothetical protein|nr:hypothetical protein [Cyclobacteriaceae bacterium]